MATSLLCQSQINKYVLGRTIFVRDLTAVRSSGGHDPWPSIETNQLTSPVAVEALPSFVNWNLYTIWIIELSNSIWFIATTLLFIRLTEKGLVILSNGVNANYTVVGKHFTIQFKVHTCN